MPILRKIKKYTAKDSKNLYKLLIKHGISEKAAQKIIKFYEEE